MADTAALVVALSAQLTKFEKDMKGAVNIADKRTKEIEASFAKMNANIQNQFTALGGGAGGIGNLAGVLGRLGPIGATAATAVLAIGAAFAHASVEVAAYAKKVDQLRNAADTTGLTINQLNELNKAGLDVGVSAEQVESSLSKMTVSIDQLREGTGPLVDTLRKMGGGLLQQVAGAKSSADAVDILARAFAKLGSEFEKNAFLRQIFGRGGLPFGRVLQQVADQGGLKAMELQAKKTGKALDDNIAKQVDDIADQIEQIKQRTTNLWGEAFGVDVMTLALRMAEYWERISKAVTDAYREARNRPPAPPGAEPSTMEGLLPPQFQAQQQQQREAANQAALEAARERAREEARSRFRFGPGPVFEPPPPDLALGIKILKDRIAALGEAATATEKYKLEVMEVRKAVEDGQISEEEGTRRLEKHSQAQSLATLVLKERLGVATEAEILQARETQFLRDANLAKLTAIEIEKGLIKVRKESRDAYEAQLVSLSQLPSVLRAGLDATFFKEFDKIIVSSLGNFENAIADIAVGTTSLKDAFKSMADSIIRDLIRMTLRLAVTGPLFQALGAAFGAPAAAGAGGFGNLFARQHGGPVRAGSPYVVGERGPELFIPKSSGRIEPHSVSRGGAAGGAVIEINNFVAADTETKQRREGGGPNPERIVIDIVKKAQARGELDDVNRGRFGLRPAKVR